MTTSIKSLAQIQSSDLNCSMYAMVLTQEYIYIKKIINLLHMYYIRNNVYQEYGLPNKWNEHRILFGGEGLSLVWCIAPQRHKTFIKFL